MAVFERPLGLWPGYASLRRSSPERVPWAVALLVWLFLGLACWGVVAAAVYGLVRLAG